MNSPVQCTSAICILSFYDNTMLQLHHRKCSLCTFLLSYYSIQSQAALGKIVISRIESKISTEEVNTLSNADTPRLKRIAPGYHAIVPIMHRYAVNRGPCLVILTSFAPTRSCTNRCNAGTDSPHLSREPPISPLASPHSVLPPF